MLAPRAVQAGIPLAVTGAGVAEAGPRPPGEPIVADVAFLGRAGFRDAKALAGVWRRVVHSGYWRSGSEDPGGSIRPGPEQDKWHMRMMFAGKYFKITVGVRVVGGSLVFDRGHGRYESGLLFLDPRYQGKGIGSQALGFLEETFPDARLWLLEVPEWNFRARAFFEHLGYRRTGRRPGDDGQESLSYEKKLSSRVFGPLPADTLH